MSRLRIGHFFTMPREFALGVSVLVVEEFCTVGIAVSYGIGKLCIEYRWSMPS